MREPRDTVTRRVMALALCAAACADAPANAQDDPPEPKPPTYTVDYEARIVPTEKLAHVTIDLGDPDRAVREIRFAIDPDRHLGFEGKGEIEIEADKVRWVPPKGGGKLRYDFRIDHLRDERSYDARISDAWTIFRGDDLVPPARVRTIKGAESRATVRLRLPDGWRTVAPYEKSDDGSYVIDHPDRRFDRPVGWFAAGDLGVLRETVADTKVAIGAPKNQDFRRQDLLALLRWTLPTLRATFPNLPERLAIVGAGDPMWRGGLSGPRSLYVHADRPAISEDGTSPLLHELVHTALGARSGPGGDWVVEGLAELYSLRILQRSGTMSERRYERALERLAKKARKAGSLRADSAGSAEAAKGALLLLELDETLTKETEGATNLDDVARELAERREPVTTESFREVAEQTSSVNLERFFSRRELAPPSE